MRCVMRCGARGAYPSDASDTFRETLLVFPYNDRVVFIQQCKTVRI